MLKNCRKMRRIVLTNFKATQVTSFKRQLKNYGFTKRQLSGPIVEFTHPQFRRGGYNELIFMKKGSQWKSQTPNNAEACHIIESECRRLKEENRALEANLVVLASQVRETISNNQKLLEDMVVHRARFETQLSNFMFVFYARGLINDKMCDRIMNELVKAEVQRIAPDINLLVYLSQPGSHANISGMLARSLIMETYPNINKRLYRYINHCLDDLFFELGSASTTEKAARFFSIDKSQGKGPRIDKPFILAQLQRCVDYSLEKLQVVPLSRDILHYAMIYLENDDPSENTAFSALVETLSDNFSAKSLKDMLVLMDDQCSINSYKCID